MRESRAQAGGFMDVTRAYYRADLLEQRAALMERWAGAVMG